MAERNHEQELAGHKMRGDRWREAAFAFELRAMRVEYVIRLLVAAGHVTQEKVDQAFALARDFKRADDVEVLPDAPVSREPESPRTLFATSVASGKWFGLQQDGYRMQSIRFARSIDGQERRGTIDPWGKVLWEPDGVVVDHAFNTTPVADQNPANLSDNASGVPVGASAQPSDRERMAAAIEALEDNDPQAAFVILKKALAAGVKACRKCGGTMKPGKAIPELFSAGDEGTLSEAAHAGPAPLVDCMKCEACGWTVTAGVQEGQS